MSQNVFSLSGFKRPLKYLTKTAAMIRNAEEVKNSLFIDGRELIAVLFVGKVDKVVESSGRVDYCRTEYSNIIPVTKCIEVEHKRQKIFER